MFSVQLELPGILNSCTKECYQCSWNWLESVRSLLLSCKLPHSAYRVRGCHYCTHSCLGSSGENRSGFEFFQIWHSSPRNSECPRDLNVHGGSEYWPFEVRISKGSSMGYIICTRPTIWILDQYIRKQDGVYLSRISNGWAVWYSKDIWKLDNLESNLFLTIWIPD